MQLIDADKLSDDIFYDSDYDNDTINHFIDLVDEQPEVDAESVVHGHWEDDGHGYYVCSQCEDYIITDEDGNPPSFLKSDWVLAIPRCPHCDAKMDEEAEKE
ncbi:MAG: hypothetical protein ACLUFN_07605 [Eubacterium sp.]